MEAWSTSPAWLVEGEDVQEFLGESVASAGDVNDDGFTDVLIGSQDYSTKTVNYRGRVQLFLGSSSGLSKTPAWSTLGEEAFASFGGAVASAGDVNADGFDDVIVGAGAFLALRDIYRTRNY